MYATKIKRKCGVRGCRNTDCFAISETRESGNSVIICRDCLANGLEAVEKAHSANMKNSEKEKAMQIPPLFYNAAAFPTAPMNVSEEETAEEASEAAEDATEEKREEANEASDEEGVAGVKCALCGKVFENEKGLAAHKRFCKGAE